MIDIAGWIEFVKVAPGYALALLIIVWKRTDDKEHKTLYREMTDAYRMLLEKVLASMQSTNMVLEGIAQASKIGERLEAIENSLDDRPKKTRR